MKKYKLILNFTLDNEEILMFDRITREKIKLMQNSKNYILLSINYCRKIIMPIGFKVPGELAIKFNNNLSYYCFDYKGVNYEH